MYSYRLYVLFCISSIHRANWHSPTTLTEFFQCFFFSYKANARVHLAKTGHGPLSSKLVNCVVLCIVCVDCVVLCIVCVDCVVLCIVCVDCVVLCIVCVDCVVLCIVCVDCVVLCNVCVDCVVL
jgi:hypothetical protein